ncbi:MAG: alpha/beta hydrolase [Planctomycetota bacterium]|nr:alpha/beta hydrolase [Planctomycetota bacterium]
MGTRQMKHLVLYGGLILMITVASGCNEPQQSGSFSNPSQVSAVEPDVDPLTAVVWKSRVVPDIVYHRVDGVDVKLDVWVPDIWLGESPWWKPASGKKPTLLYIHGGGWVGGDRQSRVLKLLPFLVRDWVVVNIDYRLAGTAKAPAAVVDCLAALEWVHQNAETYHIDTSRVVVCGDSAGGHLALLTGLLQESDSLCGGKLVVGDKFPVAAIINWFGVPDYGAHSKYHTGLSGNPDPWIDPMDDFDEAVRTLSPVRYIHNSSAPVLTIHGADDPAVLPAQAELLHKQLNAHGVRNRLHWVEGRKHGDFSPAERTEIHQVIWEFLTAVQVLPKQATNRIPPREIAE